MVKLFLGSLPGRDCVRAEDESCSSSGTIHIHPCLLQAEVNNLVLLVDGEPVGWQITKILLLCDTFFARS